MWGNGIEKQRVYRRGTELGTLRRGSDTLQFSELKDDAMQGEISRVCSLVKFANGSLSAVANPPTWLASDVLKNQSIDGVSEVKVVMSHHSGMARKS